MRIATAVLCLVVSSGIAFAQESGVKQSGDSGHSTGRTVVPDGQGQMSPQGPTGPLNTTTGGAPAESPQGQSPPGMQAAPEGSSKTMVDPKK